MEKRITLIIVAIWVSIVVCRLSCTSAGRVQSVQNVQKSQLLAEADSVGAADGAEAAVDGTEVIEDSAEAAEDIADTECESYKKTIYSRNGRTIYFETADYMVYCYAQVGNNPPRKMIFGHEYGEDSFPVMYSHIYGDNVFVVGDFIPNSNGWTVRFPIYRINARTFKMKFITDGAAVHFGKDGFKVAHCRLTNPDADCTADERWVMHDTYYNSAGKKIREDKREYDYLKMEEKYGDTLVNAHKMRR